MSALRGGKKEENFFAEVGTSFGENNYLPICQSLEDGGKITTKTVGSASCQSKIHYFCHCCHCLTNVGQWAELMGYVKFGSRQGDGGGRRGALYGSQNTS